MPRVRDASEHYRQIHRVRRISTLRPSEPEPITSSARSLLSMGEEEARKRARRILVYQRMDERWSRIDYRPEAVERFRPQPSEEEITELVEWMGQRMRAYSKKNKNDTEEKEDRETEE